MTRAFRRPALHLLALTLGAMALATPAEAQGGRRTFLYVTGFPRTATSTVADFVAGFVTLGTVTFTVDATANNPNFSPRVTTVNVRCFAPCPATGTLPSAALQWRRGDLGIWNPISTAYALVEQRTLVFGGANDPWSNTIAWRFAVDWATHPPTAATSYYIQLQLVVAAP